MKQYFPNLYARLSLAMAVLLISGAATARGADVTFTGEGTAESPYLIQSKADLISLSVLSNTGETFAGKYFRMTADIDLEHSSDFQGICVGSNTAANAFAGIFDGDGHTVDNMDFKLTVWSQQPTDTEMGKVLTSGTSVKKYQGLFGCLAESGIIRNVTIGAGSVLELNGYSAAIVGYSHGTVENCVNYADILTYGDSNVAGIVGYANYKSVIRNCVNSGDITCGSKYAAGIVGYNCGLVSGCVNTGNVTGKLMAANITETSIFPFGGITAATYSRIEYCVNFGTVTGYKTLGGIVGQVMKSTNANLVNPNDVAGNFNFGAVLGSARTETGAIAGVCRVESNFSGNVWDAQIIPLEGIGAANSDISGCTGMETMQLTSGSAIGAPDAAAWNFSAGNYPVMAYAASFETVKTARGTILALPTGKTVNDMRGVDASLSTADNLVWTLADGSGFKISGNTLQGPSSLTRLVADTLTAAANGYIKHIALKARPSMPLHGTGTAQNPYTVSSPGDWTALAYFISDAENDLTGKYVSLTQGLDFWGEEFISLGADGVTPFNGTFLGNNKLIEGIELENISDFAGLFGKTGPDALIRDLTVEGSVSLVGNTCTGAFASDFYGTLENCTNKLSIVSVHDNLSKGGTNVGGLVGKAYASARFVKCTNKAQIYAESNIGGFAGALDAGSYVSFSECTNESQIVSALGNSNSACIAGFVGMAYPCSFHDCVNKGEVKVIKSNQVSGAAGFIGKAFTAKADTIHYIFKRCLNQGNITACYNVAGLVGEVNSSIVAGRGIIMVDSCGNTGTITGGSGSSGKSNVCGLISAYTPGSVITNSWNSGNIAGNKSMYVTGIVGNAQKAPTAQYPVIIRNCHNTGAISTAYNQVAGIVGYINSYVTVDSCYNTGAITSDTYAAGGIAASYSSATGTVVKNCWNTGVIKGQNRIGGIVATNTSADGMITDCWNGGTIESTGTVAAASGNTGSHSVGGICGQAASSVTRCFNVGTLKGLGRVGGIVGVPVAGKTKLKDCYNAGIIDCPADTCGHIVGVNISNTKIWNASNEISGCVYVTDFGNKANLDNSGATPLSAGELCSLAPVDGSVSPGAYCLPVPASLAGDDATKLFASMVVPAKEDVSYSNITDNFFIGAPEGVSWTSSEPVIDIADNDCKFVQNYSGDIILTGTIGNFIKTFALKAVFVKSGITDIGADPGTDGQQLYYDLQGRRLPQPGHGITIIRNASGTYKVIR